MNDEQSTSNESSLEGKAGPQETTDNANDKKLPSRKTSRKHAPPRPAAIEFGVEPLPKRFK